MTLECVLKWSSEVLFADFQLQVSGDHMQDAINLEIKG